MTTLVNILGRFFLAVINTIISAIYLAVGCIVVVIAFIGLQIPNRNNWALTAMATIIDWAHKSSEEVSDRCYEAFDQFYDE